MPPSVNKFTSLKERLYRASTASTVQARVLTCVRTASDVCRTRNRLKLIDQIHILMKLRVLKLLVLQLIAEFLHSVLSNQSAGCVTVCLDSIYDVTGVTRVFILDRVNVTIGLAAALLRSETVLSNSIFNCIETVLHGLVCSSKAIQHSGVHRIEAVAQTALYTTNSILEIVEVHILTQIGTSQSTLSGCISAEAEAAIPGLRHAEEEVRVRGIRCAIAGASGKDRTETAAALAAAKQKLTALLAGSGRPADALEPKFTCKRCEDTGAVDGRTCDCVRRVMQQLRRKEIEELSSLSVSSFDTMQLDYYPNTVDKALGESVRSYMAEVLADLRDYAADFSPATRESLLLVGNAGLGKTHAALAIAGEVLRQNYDVIYVSCPDFFGKLEALHFGTDPGGEEETLFQTACNADLLILDDLGTEFNSSFFLTNLYSLLNNRLGAKLPTIVTTNITDGALLEKLYTEKISSRLAAFVQIQFLGSDIRVQKAAE